METRLRELQSQADTFHQSVNVALVGHSDTTGIEGTNLVLSQQRAEQIRRLLLRSGIRREILRPTGVATTQPLRSEDSEEGRQLNRSVTFKVSFAPTGAGVSGAAAAAASSTSANASPATPPGN